MSRSEDPPGHHDLTRTAFSSTPPRPGQTGPDAPPVVANFRVLRKLGEGGMGVVFEAEQDQPRRKVALKVVRGGQFVDEQRVRMFRREADTLARLEHPNIGAIYESGRTDDGQHYFAMELVEGDTLDLYLRNRPGPLDREELERRLRMFRQICDAVHYAHQRAVIHRDLKPSNIVVTQAASTGSSASGIRAPGVKVLDFGLARITDADVAAATAVTEIGVIKGTLPYMSPEQTQGRSTDLDVRTDVYSLGVILYELLTGALPYDVQNVSLLEAVRVICDVPPKPLRERFEGLRRLEADLETIVGKALQKEPDQRYASAAALSEDVERYLTSQPILAHPPSTIYQLRKLVGRNRIAAGFSVALLILLVSFAVAMAYQAQRIAGERDRAATEAAKAVAINGFLLETLGSANPWVGGGRDVTVLDALGLATGKIDGAFKDQPLIEASVRENIGETYRALGRFEESEALLRRALEIRESVQGHESAETARGYAELSSLHVYTGRYEEAEQAGREAVAIQRRVDGGARTELVAARLCDLANALNFNGKYVEAEAAAQEGVDIYREQFGERHEYVGRSLKDLATAVWYQGDLDRAFTLASESVSIWREGGATDHPGLILSLNTLAMIEMQRGNLDEAEKAMKECLEAKRRAYGDDHPEVAVSLENLGNVYYRAGRLDDSIALLEQVLDMRKRMLGEDHLAVSRTRANMAALYTRTGRDDEAREAYELALPSFRAGLGPEHPDLALVLGGLGRLLERQGDLAGAEGALREALTIREAVFADDSEPVASSRIELGLVLAARGKRAEAEDLLTRGKTIREAAKGADDPQVQSADSALDALRR